VFVCACRGLESQPAPRIQPIQRGDSRVVCQASGVPIHYLCTVLLPRCAAGAQEIWCVCVCVCVFLCVHVCFVCMCATLPMYRFASTLRCWSARNLVHVCVFVCACVFRVCVCHFTNVLIRFHAALLECKECGACFCVVCVCVFV
jgi:hypothetical protein